MKELTAHTIDVNGKTREVITIKENNFDRLIQYLEKESNQPDTQRVSYKILWIHKDWKDKNDCHK